MFSLVIFAKTRLRFNHPHPKSVDWQNKPALRNKIKLKVKLLPSCPTLCDPMDCTCPSPTHVHPVGDAIQPGSPAFQADSLPTELSVSLQSCLNTTFLRNLPLTLWMRRNFLLICSQSSRYAALGLQNICYKHCVSSYWLNVHTAWAGVEQSKH